MDMIRAGLLSMLCLAALASSPARAQNELAIAQCHNKESDPEIGECLSRLTEQADRHLNAAYQKMLKTVDPSGIAALRSAERAWLEYRKQRCYYLSAGPGTIGRIIAPDCFLRMTKARAEELDEDSKGLGPG